MQSDYSLPEAADFCSMNEDIAQKAAITIATGKRVYLDMALELARSFLFWNRSGTILFCIVTDLAFDLPPSLSGIRIIQVASGDAWCR